MAACCEAKKGTSNGNHDDKRNDLIHGHLRWRSAIAVITRRGETETAQQTVTRRCETEKPGSNDRHDNKRDDPVHGSL